MTQILIIEDTSRYELGGGQRITVEAVKCLVQNKKNRVSLYDLGKSFQLASLVQGYDIFYDFFNIRNSLYFFYKLPRIVSILLKKIDLDDKYHLYPVTKKALIVSIILKVLCKNKQGNLVFHQHSRLGFIFEWLKLFANTVIIPGIISNAYNNKTTVIHNPINSEKSKYCCKLKEKNRVVVGFIGNLTHHKGFDIFLDTLNLNEFKVIIAGQGPLENNITKNGNVKYLGYIENDKKREFYKDIDILVFPSIVEETFSLVCFEAMFNYNPIVCFDMGYPSKIVEKYNIGVVAESLSVNSLDAAIHECIENIDLYSNNCNKVISDFDNNNFCAQISSIFG